MAVGSSSPTRHLNVIRRILHFAENAALGGGFSTNKARPNRRGPIQPNASCVPRLDAFGDRRSGFARERRSDDHALGLRLKSHQTIANRRQRAPRTETKDLPLRSVFLMSRLFRPCCVTDLNLCVNPSSPTFGIETNGTLSCSEPISQNQ